MASRTPNLSDKHPRLPPATSPAARPERLRCVEWGREQPAGEPGWEAFLTTDEDERAKAVVFCPECDKRAFGAS